MALAAGAASFWTGVRSSNGINYNAPFPMAELFIAPSMLVGETAVQYSVGMGFYAKDAQESSEQEVINHQSEMDELTQLFIRLLREEEELEMVERAGGIVARTPTVRTGTKVGTGMYIDFVVNVLALPC